MLTRTQPRRRPGRLQHPDREARCERQSGRGLQPCRFLSLPSGPGDPFCKAESCGAKGRAVLKLRYKLSCVFFRETIRKAAEAEGKWIHHVGGKSEYGHVRIRIEPLLRGAGIQLVPMEEKYFPAEYFPGVAQGLMSALASGVLARYEVTDVLARVINGSYHDVDSCIYAFAQATEEAVTKALRVAEPYLLEPVISVKLTLPDEFMGSVIGEMNSREGRIESIEPGGAAQQEVTVLAKVPERTMAGFERTLAELSQGRAELSTSSGGYQELRESIARLLLYCPGCERKVLPLSEAPICPDCDQILGSGDDYDSV
jgi:translation elongation factor EF-G